MCTSPLTTTRDHLIPALLAALFTATSPAATSADTTWHEPDHPFRAEVRIESTSAHANVETAAVRLEHAGRISPAADDLRIHNHANERVPYQVTHHTPDRDTLISFRAPAGDESRHQRFWIYFGHPGAAPDPLRVTHDPTPGAGPPEPGPEGGDWIPRAGLVLQTRRRPPEPDNPMNVEQLAELIDASPRADGAAYHDNIADGANPFGHSYNYISLYRGWIEIPDTGAWAFCTISNDGSFSFLDGEALIHWPGRHTTERGRGGQFNTERDLDARRYYVEYYHEDTSLHQMAFLGWRPPGQPRFEAIPDAMFVQPHRAEVRRYEHRDRGRTLTPRVELLDSIWPDDRAQGQYTRYRLIAHAGSEPLEHDNWRIEWATGDGQHHQGPLAQHIYLTENDYELTLTLHHPAGSTTTLTRPVHVYPLEHMREDVRIGRFEDYLPLVRAYDLAALPAPDLAEAARFLTEAGEPALAREAAAAYASRIDDADTPAMHLAAAGPAGDQATLWRHRAANAASEDHEEADDAEEAEAHLQAALAATDDPAEQLEVLARLIRHTGITRGARAAAETQHEQAREQWREQRPRPRAAMRHVEIAMGDVYVHHHRFTAARDAYLAAERLTEPRVPQQVRLAQLGAYPERMRQHLAAERIGEARDELERWRHRFPASLVEGELAYWLGRVYLLHDEPGKAVAALELARDRGEGQPFEAAAHYYLGDAHLARGDTTAAQRTLRQLLDTSLTGEFRDRAEQRLRDLE